MLILISIMSWVLCLVYLFINLNFPLLLDLEKIIYRDTNSNIKASKHKSQYLTAVCNLILAYIWIQILCFLNVHTLATHQEFRVLEAASCQMIEHWCLENGLFSKAGKLAKLLQYIKYIYLFAPLNCPQVYSLTPSCCWIFLFKRGFILSFEVEIFQIGGNFAYYFGSKQCKE